MANAPDDWLLPETGEARDAFDEALFGRRSHDPAAGLALAAATGSSSPPRSSATATSSPSWSPTRPPGRCVRRSCSGWLLIAAGEIAAMLLAVGAALRLTGWVLRPVRVLDATTHDIATGRLKSRVAAAGGPPELRRLARSFNEMADNVEDVLEQQRAFVADASHQLRNPLVRAAAAHRTARPRTARGQRGDRLRPHRGQAPRPGPRRPAGPGAGRARRGGPAAHRHRRADGRARGAPGGRSPTSKGVRLIGTCPRRHRLGRPGHAVQRPGRGDRQRAEVHARGREVEVDGRLERRDLDRRGHRRRPGPQRRGTRPASATASGAAPATRTSRARASACPSPGPCSRRAAAPSRTTTTSRTACG